MRRVGIAARRLDLDDLGAEIGEILPGARAGDDRRELDDATPCERACGQRRSCRSPAGRHGKSTERVNVQTLVPVLVDTRRCAP